MKLHLAIAAVLTAAGCGGGKQQKPLSDHPQPLSVAEHHQEADRHDSEANRSEGRDDPEATRPKPYSQCRDDPIDGQSTTGGQPIEILKPCWSVVSSPTSRHLESAAQHRREAAAHRRVAVELVRTEREACAGLGADAVAHSPFYHHEDIIRVEPIRDRAGAVRGARALFAKVPGLTKSWLERAARCHQARAAVMGYSPTFMSYCPLVVAESEVSVREAEGGLWVQIESAAGAQIWQRAEAIKKGKEP